ncbi:MAG TPA: hypothetical protein VFZ70_12555 [Euzebyales bacterium]
MVAPASTLTGRRDHLLPTAPALQPLFPDAALRRGSIVGVSGTGATSLLLALLAAPNAAGAWCAAVGLDSLGLLAAEGAGVDLQRFVLVPDPGPDWPTIVAALLDAFEVVALRPPSRPAAAAQRRLAARVRERRRALLVLPDHASTGWSFDVSMTGTAAVWEGLGWGAGHLRGRQVRVRAEGRRLAGRPRHAGVWLPDQDGEVSAARPVATATPLHRDDERNRSGVA